MSPLAVIALLGLGASAVPEFMFVNTGSNSASLKRMEDAVAKVGGVERRLRESVQSGRKLQAIMSTECESACPGAKDMVMGMMEMASQETTPPPEGVDPGMAMIMAMCPHADVLVCVTKTAACQDEELDPNADTNAAAIGCLCACPGVAALGEDGAAKLCKDKSTMECLRTDKCDALTKSMGGLAGIEVMCKSEELGCGEKSENMGTCAGEEGKNWETGGCDDKAEAEEAMPDSCCTAGKKMVECMTSECMKLMVAAQSLSKEEDAKKELKKFLHLASGCPDAGLPTKAEVDATVSELETGSPAAGDETAFAAPGQRVPYFAMVAAAFALGVFA